VLNKFCSTAIVKKFIDSYVATSNKQPDTSDS